MTSLSAGAERSAAGPGQLDADLADAAACVESANALLAAGDAEQGFALLQRALTLDHLHVPALAAYARAQAAYGSWALAEEACRMVLALDPVETCHLRTVAGILYEADCIAEAEAAVDRALSLVATDEAALLLKARILRARGDFEAARQRLLALLRQNPRATDAYSALAGLVTFTPDHDLFRAMQRLADEMGAGDPAAAPLHFALGKAFEDVGDDSSAFSHLATGARLKRAMTNYDEESMFGFFDQVIATFSRDFIEERRLATPRDGPRPLFIVGMPRSGSTLIERILASHPLAFDEGERRSFAEHVAPLAVDGGPFPGLARNADRAALEDVAGNYRAYVEARCAGRPVFINKLLGNVFFVGLIHILLPHARVIVSDRDPRDQCLSIFRTLFAEDIPYGYDLGELGRYHRQYRNLLAHWRGVLPADVLKIVRYEELVAEPERQSRELLAFAGLPWDGACLDFPGLELPVRTASVVQVRRPIYRSSVGAWRRYQDQLQPLLDALDGP